MSCTPHSPLPPLSLPLFLPSSLPFFSPSLQVLLPRVKSSFFQRFSHKSAGKKKSTEAVGGGGGGGELGVSKSPLSDLGGDRLKEMEKIHTMEVEEVGKCMYILYTRTCTCIYRHTCTYTCALYMHIVYCMLHMYMYLYNIQSNVCYTCTCM